MIEVVERGVDAHLGHAGRRGEDMIEARPNDGQDQAPDDAVPHVVRVPDAPGGVVQPGGLEARLAGQDLTQFGLPGRVQPRVNRAKAPLQQELPQGDDFLPLQDGLDFIRQGQVGYRPAANGWWHVRRQQALSPRQGQLRGDIRPQGNAAGDDDAVPVDGEIEETDLERDPAGGDAGGQVIGVKTQANQPEDKDHIPVGCQPAPARAACC